MSFTGLLDDLKTRLESSLFPVSGVLAKRYNRALASMLSQNNDLEEFRVDRRGKSPEIARLLGDGYLDIGEANRFMIILSPDQKAAPLIDEICSFDEEVMEAIYTRAARTIADITRHEPMVGELDDKIQEYSTPDDLLLLDTVEIMLDTPANTVSEILKLKKMSRELGEGMNLLEGSYIDEMRKLVRRVGDIRRRGVSGKIFPIQVEIGSFYVSLFGGYFFFRNIDTEQGPHTLVVAGEQNRKRRSPGEIQQISIQSPTLIQKLQDCGLIRYSRGRIDRKLESLEDEALLEGGYDVVAMSAVERKRGLRKITSRLGDLYRDLLDVKKILKVDRNADLARVLKRKPKELRLLLAEPAKDPKVVGRLLAKLDLSDYGRRFLHDGKALAFDFERMGALRQKYVYHDVEREIARAQAAKGP